MSITSALYSSISGLTATSRGIEIVASNVANAQTDGYARRELTLAVGQSTSVGAGVRTVGVRRMLDEAALADLRLADGSVAGDEERLRFREQIGSLMGEPGTAGSLSDRIATLGASLVEASNAPENSLRLGAVARAASDVAGQLRALSDGIQQARSDADAGIAESVTRLNADLARVGSLNRAIAAAGRETDVAALKDERQRLVDGISAIIPVRELPRENGRVALVTPGGAILLDGTPAEVRFEATGTITADMTLASGALGGLTLNGKPITVGDGGGRLDGGRLGALFAIRDDLAVGAQEFADAIAVDLYQRFSDPALDPSLASGDAGLFTDGGNALAPGDEIGLAGRLQLNAAADPAQAGDLWRLRAGLNAAAPNESGDGALLARLADALSVPRPSTVPALMGANRSAGGLADQTSALWWAGSQSLSDDLAYSTARADAFRTRHLQEGVDTDHEMQNLLTLEQAYGANARVISTINALMQQLLEI